MFRRLAILLISLVVGLPALAGAQTVISTYDMNILPSLGGGTQGVCRSSTLTHAISSAARSVTLGTSQQHGTNVNAVISDQGGSISLARVTIKNAQGAVVYHSSNDTDYGSFVSHNNDGSGNTASLYAWADAPRTIDLPEGGAPYSITTEGQGCNGTSINFLSTAADMTVTEYAKSVAPSCSIRFDKNPVDAGEVTKIHWQSTNASLFYINNIGYVSGNGEATLPAASATTDYSGTVTGNGGGTALASYGVDILQKNGGASYGYPGMCFSNTASHPINPAADHITLDSYNGLPGSLGKALCEISHQGGSISQAQIFVKDKDGNIAYQSPSTVDCGTFQTSASDGWGFSEDLYDWTDGPRAIDLDPEKAPYTITTQGAGCNGWSPDYLSTAAAVMVTEYAGGTASCAAVLTVNGGGNQCTPGGRGGGTPGDNQVVTFSTPGTHTFTVPDGVTSISTKMWGGAGGSGTSGGYVGYGGGGGYSAGTIAVTPGEQLSIMVGGGGQSRTGVTIAGGVGGGGSSAGGPGFQGSAGGGGYSGIFRGSSALIIAGGGGGGVGGGSASGCVYRNGPYDGCTFYQGGAGGGANGENASLARGGGNGGALATGGTQTSGGASGDPYASESGSRFQGGNGIRVGAGGGGGYFGGGAGSASDPAVNWGYQSAGAGGSGYIASSVTNAGTIAGRAITPGDANEPTRPSGVGEGNATGAGGDGFVEITYVGPPSTDGDGGGGGGSGSTYCGADGNLHNACGIVQTCQYGCSKTTNQCNPKSQCVSIRVCSADGTRVVKSCDGSLVDDCTTHGAGYSCVAGQCVRAPMAFQSFAATRGSQSFTATGHLQVSPSLVRMGETSNVYWDVVNADNCAVTSTIADSWTGLFSGAAGQPTSPITHQVVYTLHCAAPAGVTPASIDESATVNILPVFQEQ